MNRDQAIDALAVAGSRLVTADLHPLQANGIDRLAGDLAAVRRTLREEPANVLTEAQWGLLAGAEDKLYRNRRGGHLGCTDILGREESDVQAIMWGEAYQLAEMQLDGADETSIQLECAKRVAAAQAILMFGAVPE